jgi:hypothetical protein
MNNGTSQLKSALIMTGSAVNRQQLELFGKPVNTNEKIKITLNTAMCLIASNLIYRKSKERDPEAHFG